MNPKYLIALAVLFGIVAFFAQGFPAITGAVLAAGLIIAAAVISGFNSMAKDWRENEAA